MYFPINFTKAALVASCLSVAACGGSGSPDTASSPNSTASDASVIKATAAPTTSPNGTTIPSAPQIIDASGNVWTVTAGVVYEKGALAGYSKGVTRLLYDNSLIYQENSAGGWWSWNGSTWIASAAPAVSASPNGTSIPSVTQIVDSSGNVWTVTAGVIYKNAALAGYSKGVTVLAYENNVIYQENAAGGWWSWTDGTWASSTDPVVAATKPTIGGSPATSDMTGEAYNFVPSTTNPGGGTLVFSVTNLPAWSKFSTATGAITGTPTSVQVGAYPNIAISVTNGTASASLAAFSITVAAGSATLSWTAPTENTNGTALTNLAGYTIFYGTSASALTQTVQLANPSATSYVVGNLAAGTYYFAVEAYTTAGTQSTESATGTKVVL